MEVRHAPSAVDDAGEGRGAVGIEDVRCYYAWRETGYEKVRGRKGGGNEPPRLLKPGRGIGEYVGLGSLCEWLHSPTNQERFVRSESIAYGLEVLRVSKGLIRLGFERLSAPTMPAHLVTNEVEVLEETLVYELLVESERTA